MTGRLVGPFVLWEEFRAYLMDTRVWGSRNGTVRTVPLMLDLADFLLNENDSAAPIAELSLVAPAASWNRRQVAATGLAVAAVFLLGEHAWTVLTESTDLEQHYQLARAHREDAAELARIAAERYARWKEFAPGDPVTHAQLDLLHRKILQGSQAHYMASLALERICDLARTELVDFAHPVRSASLLERAAAQVGRLWVWAFR